MLYTEETEINLRTHCTKEQKVTGEIIFSFFFFCLPAYLLAEFNSTRSFNTRHAPVEFAGQND